MSSIRALNLLVVATWAIATAAPAAAAPGDYVGTQPPAVSPPAPSPYAGVPVPGGSPPPGVLPPGGATYAGIPPVPPDAGIPPASSYVGVPPIGTGLSGSDDRTGRMGRAGQDDDSEEVGDSSSLPMTTGDAAGLAAMAAFATGVVLTLRKRA